MTPPAWEPKYLAPDQVGELFARDLAQAEARARAAWVAWQVAEEDYQAALVVVARIEAALTQAAVRAGTPQEE